MKAYLEIRSQHVKQRGRYRGPDTYVAVQIVPDGVQKLRVLNNRAAKKRGIEIVYCGEGYKQYTGPRSRLGQAIEYGKQIVESVNNATNRGYTRTL